MRRKTKESGMWAFLEECGVLEKGSDAEIKEAKRAYRKKYFLKYKREQRSKRPEFTICLLKNNGDFDTIQKAAKKHKMTMTAFIRTATLAYIRKTYVVPDRLQIAHLEQLLSDCLNEIQTIVHTKEKFFWERERKLDLIEKRIIALESKIKQ